MVQRITRGCPEQQESSGRAPPPGIGSVGILLCLFCAFLCSLCQVSFSASVSSMQPVVSDAPQRNERREKKTWSPERTTKEPSATSKETTKTPPTTTKNLYNDDKKNRHRISGKFGGKRSDQCPEGKLWPAPLGPELSPLCRERRRGEKLLDRSDQEIVGVYFGVLPLAENRPLLGEKVALPVCKPYPSPKKREIGLPDGSAPKNDPPNLCTRSSRATIPDTN